MVKKSRVFSTAVMLVVLLLVAACGGSSDAARILEADNTSLRATISYYQALDPTMTVQAAATTGYIATLQTDLDRAREDVKALTIQLNTGSGQPPAVGNPGNAGNTGAPVAGATNDPSGFGSVPTLAVAQPPAGGTGGGTGAPAAGAGGASGPVTAASGLTIDSLVTARGKDGNDCARNETNTFTASDTQIYAVATIRNYKRGTGFATKWAGDNSFAQEYDWTIDRAGSQICVYFFIEPGTLAMTPGTYNVTFTATDGSGETIQIGPLAFVLQ